MNSILLSVLRTVGSLFVAVLLFAMLTVVLGLTTFIESAYGEPVVRYFVYDSWWFHALLLLFALNVLGSMLLRMPWKKAYWPFWSVHLGIIVLLVGCYITAKGNQEANLTILEGKSARFAVAHGHHFALTPLDFDEAGPKDLASQLDRERRETISVPFEGGPLNWNNYSRAVWFDETKRPYRFSLWCLMNLAGRQKGNVFHRGVSVPQGPASDVKIEVLDYLGNSEKAPAGPLDMSVKWSGKDPEKAKLQITPQIGRLRGNDSMIEFGLGAAQTFAGGEQITFRIAESQAEAKAFSQSAPGEITSGLGVIVLTYRGEKHVVSLDEVLQQQVAVRPKRDALRERMSELMRKKQDPTEETPEEIDAQIARLFQEINDAYKESFYPLPGTNLSLEVARFVPTGALMQSDLPTPSNSENTDKSKISTTGPMVHFTLHTPGGETDQLLLYSGRPDLNTQAKKLGVYATYWLSATYSKTNAVGVMPAYVLEQASAPRLDLLQTPQGKIAYRYWGGDRLLADGEVATEQKTAILPNGPNGLEVADLKFVPHDLPGYNILPVPFAKDLKFVPQQRTKLRCTIDGVAEDFWILAQFSQQDLNRTPLDEEQVRWLQGKNGTVRLAYARNEVDLGFSLYLKKFSQKMEPGTQIASQFSSLVDMRAPDETADRIDLAQPRNPAERGNPHVASQESSKEADAIRKDVLIRMNQPGLFTDQFTGRKYRVYQSGRQGPIGPLSPLSSDRWEFYFMYDKEILPGETEPRDSLYKTILSVNYDPGRGLKYLGCALLVFGTAWMFYGRKKSDASSRQKPFE